MKYPWIPVLTALLLGIVLTPATRGMETSLLYLSIVVIILATIFSIFKKFTSAYYITLIAFCCFGTIQTSRELHFEKDDHLASLVASGKIDINSPLEVSGVTTAHPERGMENLLLTVEVAQVTQLRKSWKCSGQISLYLKLSKQWASRFFRCPQGSQVRFITRLRIPRGFENPGCIDFPALLRLKQITYTGSINSPLVLEINTENRSFSLPRVLSSLRSDLEESIFKRFSDSEGLSIKGAFINALILGNRGYLDDNDLKPLKRAGLMHITAISGFHIWIVGLLAFTLLRLAGLPHRSVIFFSMLLMFFYWSISGGRSSTTRAVIIAIIFLCGKLFARKTWFFNNLALAAFVILFCNPLDLYNPGFQLTFAAVISIALCYQQIKHNLQMLKWLAPPLSASLAAQIGVIPLVAWHFNTINLHSAISSLIIIPVATVAIFVSFLFLLAAQFIPFVSDIFASLLSLSFGMFLEVAGFADSAFPFSMRLPAPPIWLIVFYYMLIVLWLLADKYFSEKNDYPSRMIYFSGLFSLVLAVTMVVVNPFVQPEKDHYTLHAIDVGQGDSWFFNLPDGKGVLIDGGGNPISDFDVGENVVSPVLWNLGFRTLEAVIATHPDSDHMEGLIAVIDNFQVEQLWLNLPYDKPPLLLKLLEHAEKRKVRVMEINEDRSFKTGEATFQFLAPPHPAFKGRDASNNNSAIIQARFPTGSFLVTGDSEIPALERVTRLHRDSLKTKILMVPHHGSRDALYTPFLDGASPEIALVGVGHENVFGFPHSSVIKALEIRRIPLLRTDKLGMISLEIGKSGILIKTGRKQLPLEINKKTD